MAPVVLTDSHINLFFTLIGAYTCLILSDKSSREKHQYTFQT